MFVRGRRLRCVMTPDLDWISYLISTWVAVGGTFHSSPVRVNFSTLRSVGAQQQLPCRCLFQLPYAQLVIRLRLIVSNHGLVVCSLPVQSFEYTSDAFPE